VFATSVSSFGAVTTVSASQCLTNRTLTDYRRNLKPGSATSLPHNSPCGNGNKLPITSPLRAIVRSRLCSRQDGASLRDFSATRLSAPFAYRRGSLTQRNQKVRPTFTDPELGCGGTVPASTKTHVNCRPSRPGPDRSDQPTWRGRQEFGPKRTQLWCIRTPRHTDYRFERRRTLARPRCLAFRA
jgi:hypothetical protein